MSFESFGVYRNEERPAPIFELPSGTGQKVRSWDYKQRKPLVLYFLEGSESEFLTRLQEENQAYRDFGAQLLVVTALEEEQARQLTTDLGLTFPLLADPAGRVHTKFIKLTYPQYDPEQVKPKPVALFVADRYGSIYRYATALAAEKLPGQAAIMEVLEFMGNLCNP